MYWFVSCRHYKEFFPVHFLPMHKARRHTKRFEICFAEEKQYWIVLKTIYCYIVYNFWKNISKKKTIILNKKPFTLCKTILNHRVSRSDSFVYIMMTLYFRTVRRRRFIYRTLRGYGQEAKTAQWSGDNRQNGGRHGARRQAGDSYTRRSSRVRRYVCVNTLP